MKKINSFLILAFLCFNIITAHEKSNLAKIDLKDGTIYQIDETISGTEDYRTKKISFAEADTINYLKYDFSSNVPKSLITSFRIDISPYSSTMSSLKVFCTNVPSSATDSELISAIDQIKSDETKSTCLHINQNDGTFDSLIKLDGTNTVMAIGVYIPAYVAATAKINLRIKEEILGISDLKPSIVEIYSIIPVTIDTQLFRNSDQKASKLLFYSKTNVLYMYESISGNAPVELFNGNIMNVYTNPEMIKQKYHNSFYMTLLTTARTQNNNLQDSFTFELVLLGSSSLLDYYVSSSPTGRVVNSPLLINMTVCTEPYYVIFNYNSPDTRKTLILDEIYGKLKSFGIATELTQDNWKDMTDYDIKAVNIEDRKYELPANSPNHIDVYKLECTLPIMLNFYYIDDTSQSSKMGEGDVHIFILEPYETLNVPFVSGVSAPEIVIEIHHPENTPNVQIKVADLDEKIYTENTLDRFVPMTISNGITIRELGALSSTRIIIKVGYAYNSWKQTSPNIKYNENNRTYLFEFPKDAKEGFYTFGNLTISGTNSQDNVKFCFTSSIGGALKPSSENCYRVSKTNSYTLRFYNPYIMYKTYTYSKDLKYSVTLKPMDATQSFGIVAHMSEYDTTLRNYEGINNKITIDGTNSYSSILTPPESKPNIIFLQIQVCDTVNDIRTEVMDVLTYKSILSEEVIKAGKKNYYRTFSNVLMDTEFYARGQEGAEVFLRMIGTNSVYTPSFNSDPKIKFENTTNTLIIDSPLNTNEDLNITVLIDTENTLKNKKYTLCSFVDTKFESLAKYHKTVIVKNVNKASIHINFREANFNPGDGFDALFYIEQQNKYKMVFLSDVYQGTVGEIGAINVINQTEGNYDYAGMEEYADNYYFSYIPEDVLDLPIGALSVIADPSSTGNLTGVYCAFVDINADPETMIDTVEKAIEENKSYCYGSQSGFDKYRYNYIFKYVYEDKTPKQMVIKVANGNSVNVKFNIYIKKDQGVQIESTDFTSQKEYGREENEESTRTVVPYIVDLEKIRGATTKEYISKVLFYSTYLELQMFYLSDDNNAPVKLFAANLALVYTKPELAEQKYHSKILILFTENLEGKTHPAMGNTFRFHTKMFNSEAMIEFIVSQNPSGRTLNFPLSLEMNYCKPTNNKLYYILNYNAEEPQRTLHLDMIFGKYTSAKIATTINIDKWDSLIKSNSMQTITDFRKILPANSQHIDVIEIECHSPLLINAYYTKESIFYADIEKGGVAIKVLSGKTNYDFSFKKYSGNENNFDYSISVYNPNDNPDVTLTFSDNTIHRIRGNSIQTGFILSIPQRVKMTNNIDDETRVIFKFGYGVELSGWEEIEQDNMKGNLYTKNKVIVYKFPTTGNQARIRTVDITVNPLNDAENTKFCYSTNIGTPIASSRENCFRTGKEIPYTLTFVNPLIIGKDYDMIVSSNRYYVTFTPFDETEGISVSVKENQYETANRNELGVANKLTLSTSDVSSILSMPSRPLDVLFQIQPCKTSSFADSDYIIFNLDNAYTGDQLHQGKVYFRDPYGIYYISNLQYMENQVELTRDKSGNDIDVFLKHSALYSSYEPVISSNFILTFDQSTNALTISKPILGESFEFTVIVGKKESIKTLTLCDLAFTSDKSQFGDYVNTFISTTSDIVIHRIPFASMSGYGEGTTFYATAYGKQSQNSKMEFMYTYIEGKVSKVTGTIKIETPIDTKNDYLRADYTVNQLYGNYFYYDFGLRPAGNVAAFRIVSEIQVSKVGCVFVEKGATEDVMQEAVNQAIAKGQSCCVYDPYSGAGVFNALVSANYKDGNNRLVIQVLYVSKENDLSADTDAYINFKTGGTELSSTGEKADQEQYTIIPYVIKLAEIRRNSGKDYVSKILLYSNTKEMEMLYIPDDSPAPKSLFTGNIMLLYTNEELIKQKYQTDTTILLAKVLTQQRDEAIGNIRFVTYFYNSQTNIQYFLSSNSEGRPLNNPTAIEMTSCTQPYYYIMNYNKREPQRKLHIDTVYGERKSVRIATALNRNTWDELVENMDTLSGEEIILTPGRFHFDIIELTCNVPLLVNLFYTDPENTKINNLEVGDITVLSLEKVTEQALTFTYSGDYYYIFSFTVENEARKPKLSITFDGGEQMDIDEKGVYVKYTLTQYEKVLIKNVDNGGNSPTRIIFKFGYAIEASFKPDGNGIYHNLEDKNRKYNLYGYIYDPSSTRLSFTGVDFEVSTTGDNVKFCYSTNLGTYIYPSLQNCYRVGKNNPYTISTLNPNVMYRNYEYDEHINYYVGFRTVNINETITIKPVKKNYNTNNRNLEETNTVLKVTSETGEVSTILTAPKSHNNYISIEYCLCTQKAHASYQLLNAYNNTNLGYDGEINNNDPKYLTIENTKLDTELKIFKAQKDTEIFVKHSGISLNKKRIASTNKIKITYNKENSYLNWTQPIYDQNFTYTLFFDEIGKIKEQHFTLCNTTKGSKLGLFTKTYSSNSRSPGIKIDKDGELKGLPEQFDVIIIAEEVEDFKITVLSATYDSEGGNDEPAPSNEVIGEEPDNTGLVVLISILSAVIIVGIIIAVYIFYKYKSKGQVISQNKQTSMALLNSTKEDKLVESQVQVDP